MHAFGQNLMLGIGLAGLWMATLSRQCSTPR